MTEMRFPEREYGHLLRDRPCVGEVFAPTVRMYPPRTSETPWLGERWEGSIIIGGVEVGLHAMLEISAQFTERGCLPMEEIRKRLDRELSHGYGQALKRTFSAHEETQRRLKALEEREVALTRENSRLKVYINENCVKKRWWNRLCSSRSAPNAEAATP